MVERNKTLQVKAGNVLIGGGSTISIQSMTNTDTRDVEATVKQIKLLEEVGCELVRVAVPDEEAAGVLGAIKKRINIPLIADIHFNHRLALTALEEGVDKVRVNPGNIGSRERVKEVVNSARDKGVPIRIGVNAGSVEKSILEKYGAPTAEALAESAMGHVRLLEELNFKDIVISLKAAEVEKMIKAYLLISKRVDYPLHLGVTEAGTFMRAAVKSSVGMGHLLLNGIGDTIRVSITGDPLEEIMVAREILRSTGLRLIGPEIISCPTCGRCEIGLISLAEEVERRVRFIKHPIKLAIMGCVVNGPGEAREADIGIAGGRGAGVLFKKGKVLRKVPEDKLVEELMGEVDTYLSEQGHNNIVKADKLETEGK